MNRADRQLVAALARALGVSDLSDVVRVTLNLEVGKLATLHVERLVGPDRFSHVQQLQLRAELPPEQLRTLADAQAGAGVPK